MKTNSHGELEAINVAIDRPELVTPTALLAALYAEYDGLLDSFESVHSQLKLQDRRNETMRGELQRKKHDICEALADVHEKLDDFDFVIMSR